ncbi:hypothetical protein HN011_008160 [Eciton burchellii]|nr:hypothetical protein HN011_008160 [Eciton burchellii]
MGTRRKGPQQGWKSDDGERGRRHRNRRRWWCSSAGGWNARWTVVRRGRRSLARPRTQNTPRKCSKPQEAPLRERSAFSVRTVKRLSAIESSRIRTTEERGRTLGYDGEVGSASRPRRATKNIGESMSRLDLGLQNLSAMAHQTRSLPQLRIKFCATVAASLQIVLLLTVLPQEVASVLSSNNEYFSNDAFKSSHSESVF